MDSQKRVFRRQEQIDSNRLDLRLRQNFCFFRFTPQADIGNRTLGLCCGGDALDLLPLVRAELVGIFSVTIPAVAGIDRVSLLFAGRFFCLGNNIIVNMLRDERRGNRLHRFIFRECRESFDHFCVFCSANQTGIDPFSFGFRRRLHAHNALIPRMIQYGKRYHFTGKFRAADSTEYDLLTAAFCNAGGGHFVFSLCFAGCMA